MPNNESLKTDVSTHFEFGENWEAYSETIDSEKIHEAEIALQNLISAEDIVGRSFLDIGCGSGVHSLAALNLGAASITAIDIDPRSVATAQSTLAKYAPTGGFICKVGNVFSPPFENDERFDIVYSWGVLHHTGDMWKAIEKAIDLVSPGGKLVIAIYLKTRFCTFWKTEKRIFTSLPKLLRWPIVWLYSALYFVRILATGRNPISHIANYKKNRGMSWYRDRIDWLGGYPYESASPEEIIDFVDMRGGKLEKALGGANTGIGLWGTRCAEYVFEFGDTVIPPESSGV